MAVDDRWIACMRKSKEFADSAAGSDAVSRYISFLYSCLPLFIYRQRSTAFQRALASLAGHSGGLNLEGFDGRGGTVS